MSLCICTMCLIASAITTYIVIKAEQYALEYYDYTVERLRSYFDVARDISRDMKEKHKLPDVVYDEQGNKYVRMDTKIGAFCYEKIDS